MGTLVQEAFLGRDRHEGAWGGQENGLAHLLVPRAERQPSPLKAPIANSGLRR